MFLLRGLQFIFTGVMYMLHRNHARNDVQRDFRGIVIAGSGDDDAFPIDQNIAAQNAKDPSLSCDMRRFIRTAVRDQGRIAGDPCVAADLPGHDASTVFRDRILFQYGVPLDISASARARIPPQRCIATYAAFFRGDGIIIQPTFALAAQIVFTLNKPSQLTGANVFLYIPQCPDAVQPRVLRMGDIGDFIFFVAYLASPLSLFCLAGDLADNSVSTYSLMIPSAL